MDSNTLNIKKVKSGKAERISFAKTEVPYVMPDLLSIAKESYEKFLNEGIGEVLNEYNPIIDYSNKAELSFLGYTVDRTPKNSWSECKIKQTSYTIPLKVNVRLLVKETGQIMDQEVFMGDIPYMSKDGGFICNGVERVVLNQLVKAPGAIFGKTLNKYGFMDYDGAIQPSYGMWVQTEQVGGETLRVIADRRYKMSLGVFLKCFGYTNEDLLEIFNHHPYIVKTLEKEPQITQEDALIEFGRRTRPGEIPNPENTLSYINDRFFNQQHYNLEKVGRFKLNKKLSLANRITDQIAATDVKLGKKVFVSQGELIDSDTAWAIQNAGINSVDVLVDDKVVRVVGNKRVDLKAYAKLDKEEFGITELVYLPLLQEIMKACKDDQDMLKAQIKANAHKLEDYQVTLDDFIATVSYHLNLIDGLGETDEIDNLSMRRVATSGELLRDEFRRGMAKLQTQVREALQSRDLTDVTPSQIVNARYINKVFKDFMATSQLVSLMDQTNPAASLRNKRRLSSTGPGGVKRERATAEVRDINPSHYGRICVVETPEGQPIGLMTSIAAYARVNRYGFIETPYRKVDPKTKKVLDEPVFLMADEEKGHFIAQSSIPLNPDKTIKEGSVDCRHNGQPEHVDSSLIDLVDLSPRQELSVGAGLIPFVEYCAANRALMGTNMQCQSVQLLRQESPIVGTGLEHRIAADSGALILAEQDGVCKYVSADYITMEYADGSIVNHKLRKFERTNEKACFNQKPLVKKGERVKAGDTLADGDTEKGELALGKNMTVAFMNWEGYNFEDAILVNERVVRDDAFTSICIQQVKVEARTTKLGDEEITRDIAGVGEEALKNLDENGIVRIGTEVKRGDILVGKVTPKGETDLTPEERLLKAIFGEKTKDVKNTSLKVKPGEEGVVVGIEILSRKNKDELDAGVNMCVKVYIAQKRILQVGDKLAGRYGNKGVISVVLPESDMPYMPNGETVDIVLNPLGVPSRMNLGQLMEMHLGWAAKQLDWKVVTPAFDGATKDEIRELLRANNLPEDGKMQLYDGRTGLPFENKTTVGVMYMLKLIHMVDDKIHARGIGTYALITQQPLGGRNQLGGQRFGEMEVWALEAYGASRLLQEMLTIKSDDVDGRIKTYEAIVKGEPIPEPGMPESFKVLVKEMQGLCLDVKILTADNHELTINEVSEEGEEVPAVEPVNKQSLEDVTLAFDDIQSDYQNDVNNTAFDDSDLFDDLDE